MREHLPFKWRHFQAEIISLVQPQKDSVGEFEKRWQRKYEQEVTVNEKPVHLICNVLPEPHSGAAA